MGAKLKTKTMNSDELIAFLDRIVYGPTEEDRQLNIKIAPDDFVFLREYYWKILMPVTAKEIIFKALIFNSAGDQIPSEMIDDIMLASENPAIIDLAQTEIERRDLKF